MIGGYADFYDRVLAIVVATVVDCPKSPSYWNATDEQSQVVTSLNRPIRRNQKPRFVPDM